MNLRTYYSAQCPCCANPIDIFPPDSHAAEATGLTHRCSWCRRLLLTTIERPGRLGIPIVLVIGPSDRSPQLEPGSSGKAGCHLAS